MKLILKIIIKYVNQNNIDIYNGGAPGARHAGSSTGTLCEMMILQ